MRADRAAAPALLLALAFALADTAVAAPGERFSYRGLGPAAAGQALAQAEAALRRPLQPEAIRAAQRADGAASKPASGIPPAGLAACHYRTVERQPGVRYAVAGGVVTRVETRDPRYATVSGVHVGDTEAQAIKAYGKRITVMPHPYFDKGHMLAVYSGDRRYALVMETNDSGHIITLRGGQMPDVGWLEGCS